MCASWRSQTTTRQEKQQQSQPLSLGVVNKELEGKSTGIGLTRGICLRFPAFPKTEKSEVAYNRSHTPERMGMGCVWERQRRAVDGVYMIEEVLETTVAAEGTT